MQESHKHPVGRPRPLREALRLAWADYWHEGLMSVCAILGLAAVLAPLLVLFGVRQGLVEHLNARLLEDPANLEIVPLGSGRYAQDWLETLGQKREVAFVIPQTRAIAATLDLLPGEGSKVTASLIPTARGDPLMARWRPDLAWPAAWGMGFSPEPEFPIVLSEPAARKLNLAPGTTLVTGELSRRREGRLESERIGLRLIGVLPLEAQAKEAVYGPLELLLAAEDFRDGRSVPALGWPGAPSLAEGRFFASFRLYARNLAEVAVLRDYFQARRIEVHTQAEAIEAAFSLSRSLALVLLMISGTAVLGFLAASAASALAGVRRKSRSLGLMRLMGHSLWGLRLFPLAQAWLTGLLGFGLAWLFYLGVVWGLKKIFADSLNPGQGLAVILPHQALAALGLTLALSGLAALAASWRAAAIEPAEIIRDI